MDGFSYNKQSILEKYDPVPTTDSTKLVDSGTVKSYVDGELATINSEVDAMIDRVGNPFTFKGTVAATSNLPSSGNTTNDTYFVEDTGFMYTWNGSSWSKSSTDVNNQLAHDIATEYDGTKADYKAGDLVMYNNQVYIRKADASAAEGTFVTANWTATNIADQLVSQVTNLKSAIKVFHSMLLAKRAFIFPVLSVLFAQQKPSSAWKPAGTLLQLSRQLPSWLA